MTKKTKNLYLPLLILLVASAGLIGLLLHGQEQSQVLFGIKIIFLSFLISYLGFLLIYRFRMRNMQNQLYKIFRVLETFDIDEPTAVQFKESNLNSINELNDYLYGLINRIQKNYQVNKQFTANAAHELQTPLAIIKGNIELLVQSPRLGEKEMGALGIILNNTNRLARLNAALILLSKIEHNRFGDFEVVGIEKIIEEILGNFNDLLQIQELEIRKKYAGPLEVKMSATLAEILTANLIQNAIRHNIKDGWIEISTQKSILKITNPGKVLTVEPSTLFKRFRRETHIEESLGLGLSIIKRICDQHQFVLKYSHEKGIHSLEVNFKP